MKAAADKKKVFLGVEFRIDRPKGFVKTWDLPDGGKKTYTYPVDYGYFPGLKGEDDEGLDAFVGDDPDGHFESFQKLKLNGRGPGFAHELDETKFVLGLTDAERRAVYALYEKDQVHARKVYRNMAEAVADAERIGGKAPAKTALYRVKAASRANPFGLVSANGLLQDADEEHEALLNFKAAFLDFQKPVYVPYPVYVQVPVAAQGGPSGKPAGGGGAAPTPGAPHKHRRHYHRHKHAAAVLAARLFR